MCVCVCGRDGEQEEFIIIMTVGKKKSNCFDCPFLLLNQQTKTFFEGTCILFKISPVAENK